MNDLKDVAIPIVFFFIFLCFLNTELISLNHKSELGVPVMII